MVLHGHIEQKKAVGRILLILHLFDQVLVIGLVAHVISQKIPFLIAGFINEIVESHILVTRIAVPVFTRIRMHGDGPVALVL